MFKRVIFILFIIIILLACKSNLVNQKVDKIIIERRDHEYIGKEIEKVEISDEQEINKILNKLNDYQEYAAKFAGKYYIIMQYKNKELLKLRTNGSNFEILGSSENNNIRYFKINSELDLLNYF